MFSLFLVYSKFMPLQSSFALNSFESFQSFCPQKHKIEGKPPCNALKRLSGKFLSFQRKEADKISVHALLYEKPRLLKTLEGLASNWL